MRAALLSPLLFAAACGVDAEVFHDDFPVGICDRLADCRPLGSDDLGEVTGDQCVAEWTATVESLDGEGACEYDPGQGRQCLRAVEDSTCDERTAIYYECKWVYDGDSEACILDTSSAL